MSIDELLARSCRRGHPRLDAYIGISLSGRPFPLCRQCIRERTRLKLIPYRDTRERDEKVAAHYRQSGSLRGTGTAFGMSHEMVRKIVALY